MFQLILGNFPIPVRVNQLKYFPQLPRAQFDVQHTLDLLPKRSLGQVAFVFRVHEAVVNFVYVEGILFQFLLDSLPEVSNVVS